VLQIARRAVEAARSAGADFADARFVLRETEGLTVKNQEMEGVSRARSEGVGIRVLVNGYWGFAATARHEEEEIERTARLAVEIARAAARLPRDPVELAEVEPVTATWLTPVAEDPFTVPLDEKVSLLMEASRRLGAVPGLAFGEASLDFLRERTSFASSEGAGIEQVIIHSGGGIEATAIGDGEMQRRSFPNSFRGHFAAAGYEHIRSLGLVEEAERVGTEAMELLSAPDCPSMETTLILDASQMVLQIHESVGHPVELDRVLGMEEAYAGSSFLTPEDRGRLRYGSDRVSKLRFEFEHGCGMSVFRKGGSSMSRSTADLLQHMFDIPGDPFSGCPAVIRTERHFTRSALRPRMCSGIKQQPGTILILRRYTDNSQRRLRQLRLYFTEPSRSGSDIFVRHPRLRCLYYTRQPISQSLTYCATARSRPANKYVHSISLSRRTSPNTNAYPRHKSSHLNYQPTINAPYVPRSYVKALRASSSLE
jgi:hypothetical protein